MMLRSRTRCAQQGAEEQHLLGMEGSGVAPGQLGDQFSSLLPRNCKHPNKMGYRTQTCGKTRVARAAKLRLRERGTCGGIGQHGTGHCR